MAVGGSLRWEDIYAGRSVVGDDDSLSVFYRLEGEQERGYKGMRPTTMVDLQCVNFGFEEELGDETTEGRGGEGTGLTFRKRME
jgi:hypothetical protein